jgi:glycyl-tRNA synthetase beta chain
VTYGHRFLTTSGRAGRAIKVRSFDDYRARLLENFVILERSERHDKIVRELDAKAVRLKGRVSRVVHAESALLDEVPDLVEYPSVVAGTFSPEFVQVLPEEVLTTTLVHHQHYFPVEDDRGRLKPAFLAVVNMEPENERTIAANAERVVTARLRDAMFFWHADRRATLESRIDRLSTLLFHKKLGSYKDKAERVERLASWIARESLGASEEVARQAATAGRLAKADLTTDMVREFTELLGVMGGIYAREEGLPEAVWKAIYFHYLPIGVEAAAPPTLQQLGGAAVTWTAVSLADKLDTIVGLFSAGERPTGSRDPFGLRRAAQGIMKILTDFSGLQRPDGSAGLSKMLEQAHAPFAAREAAADSWKDALGEFLVDRALHLLEQRGIALDEAKAVLRWWDRPHTALRRGAALAEARRSPEFEALALLFKRVKNITKGFDGALTNEARARLVGPAEAHLLSQLDARVGSIEGHIGDERFGEAMREAAALKPPVERFFADVLVMSENPDERAARLALLAYLRRTILSIADISEIAAEPT